jgi:hypothetical protein
MKLLTLVSALTLFSTLSLGAALPPPSVDNANLGLFERQEESDLAQRAPAPAPIVKEDEGGVLEERASGGRRVKPGRAPPNFSPDGSSSFLLLLFV